MKMKELEERTGVSRESIRVWIRKGLLPEPERPRKTVAHYTEKHVRAILAIKQIQKDHRLTLEEIGEMMRGQLDFRVEGKAFTHLENLLSTSLGYDTDQVPIASLTRLNPKAVSDAKAFESIGLVERIKSDKAYSVSRHDAYLIGIWGKMREAGFVESTNFYPEMLDHYVKAAQFLADQEAERFLARTEGRIDEATAARMLTVALPMMMDFFAALRVKFFLQNVRRDPETGQPMISFKHLSENALPPIE